MRRSQNYVLVLWMTNPNDVSQKIWALGSPDDRYVWDLGDGELWDMT